jgi:hypothetical protein
LRARSPDLARNGMNTTIDPRAMQGPGWQERLVQSDPALRRLAEERAIRATTLAADQAKLAADRAAVAAARAQPPDLGALREVLRAAQANRATAHDALGEAEAAVARAQEARGAAEAAIEARHRAEAQYSADLTDRLRRGQPAPPEAKDRASRAIGGGQRDVARAQEALATLTRERDQARAACDKAQASVNAAATAILAATARHSASKAQAMLLAVVDWWRDIDPLTRDTFPQGTPPSPTPVQLDAPTIEVWRNVTQFLELVPLVSEPPSAALFRANAAGKRWMEFWARLVEDADAKFK